MKVLLCEHKRHTDRGISSTPSVVLYLGGTPGWTWPGYSILLCLDLGRVPPLDLAGVTPLVGQVGYPSCLDLAGGYPTWPGWTWLGYPLQLDLARVPLPHQTGPGWGTPNPCGQTDGRMDGWTDTCQNITFPRTTYAVGNEEISGQRGP